MPAKKKKKPFGPKPSLLGLKSRNIINPEDIDALRAGVFDIVKKNIPRVREVFDGKRVWSNQQVKLYLSLMDKVMPTLTASHNIHEHVSSLDELSLEELKRLASAEFHKLESGEPPVQNVHPELVIDDTPVVPMTSPLFFVEYPELIENARTSDEDKKKPSAPIEDTSDD